MADDGAFLRHMSLTSPASRNALRGFLEPLVGSPAGAHALLSHIGPTDIIELLDELDWYVREVAKIRRELDSERGIVYANINPEEGT